MNMSMTTVRKLRLMKDLSMRCEFDADIGMTDILVTS